LGIRETLNENRKLTIGVVSALIVLALTFVVISLVGGGSGVVDAPEPVKMYYTDDDGATTFVDDATKLVPFERNGKPAVRARVFTCDGGKTKFVGYLERYSPEAKAALDKVKGTRQEAAMLDNIQTGGMEVKKAGPGNRWTRQMTPEARPILNVRCPDGKTENLEPVSP
jgi:hypothetical protein